MRSIRSLAVGAAVLGLLVPAAAPAFAKAGPQGPVMSPANTLTLAVNSPTYSLDPALMNDVPSQHLGTALYQALVQYKPGTYRLAPLLATSWSHDTTDNQWTFQLRHGVHFTDGTTMTSKDVVASVERTLKMGQGMSYLIADVTKVQAVGPDAVRFDLSDSNPDFAYGLSEIMIMSAAAIAKHPASWFTSHADGTGPYEVQSFKPGGSKYVLTAFPGYWGGWSGHHFTKLVFEEVESDATQLLLLENGSVDYSENIPVTDFAQLKTNPQVKLVVTKVAAPFYIAMDTVKGPLANIKVRQAISDAFDYVASMKSPGAMDGYASAMRGPVPPMLPHADTALAPGKQNLAMAKKLLAQAGYPHGGFKLTFLYLQHWLFEQSIGLILQQDLKSLGIDVVLQGQPWATITARIASKTNAPDMVMFEDEVPTPSAYQLLQPMYQSSSTSWEHFQFSNSQVDTLLAQYGKTLSPSRRKTLSVKLQQMLYHLYPAIWVFNQDDLRTFRSDIQGYSFQPAFSSILNYYGMYRK